MEFYRHSGRMAPLGVFIASLFGILTAAVLGVVYAYSINWIPLIYANVLAVMGLGVAVGVAVGKGAMIGKMRNAYLVYALGLVCGLLAVTFAWISDPMARFNAGFVTNVEDIWAYMQFGYDNGFWTLGKGENMPVVGRPLAAVWVIEACVVLVGATIFAGRSIASRPFCEQDDQWTNIEEDVTWLYEWDPANNALQRLSNGDLSVLSELIRAVPGAAQYLRVDLATCPTCAECNCLSLKRVVHSLDKKGNEQKKVVALLTNLRVSHEDAVMARQAGRDLTAEELQAYETAGTMPADLAAVLRRQLPPEEGAAPVDEMPLTPQG